MRDPIGAGVRQAHGGDTLRALRARIASPLNALASPGSAPLAVLPERPYLQTHAQYVERALIEPVDTRIQDDGRTQNWIFVPEADKYLRVAVLATAKPCTMPSTTEVSAGGGRSEVR